jgi:hypothetical protein
LERVDNGVACLLFLPCEASLGSSEPLIHDDLRKINIVAQKSPFSFHAILYRPSPPDTGIDVIEINVDFKVALGDSFLVGLLLSSKGCSFLGKLENEKPLHAQGMRSGARRCGYGL